MKRSTIIPCLALCGALLAPALSLAAAPAPVPFEVSCTRPGLQEAVNRYIAAQTKGDLTGLPLSNGLGYWENNAPADVKTGFITKALKIDHHRSLIDTDGCQAFTEVIVTDKAAPYVAGTRIRVNHDKIAEIEIIWTTTGYWLFNADEYLQFLLGELGSHPRGEAQFARRPGPGGQRLPRRVPGKEDRPGALGLSLRAH